MEDDLQYILDCLGMNAHVISSRSKITARVKGSTDGLHLTYLFVYSRLMVSTEADKALWNPAWFDRRDIRPAIYELVKRAKS